MELMRTIFFFCFFQIWLRDSSSELNVLPGAPRTTPGILQVNQFSSHSATFPSSITRRSHKSPHLSYPEYHCLVHQSRERIATAYVSWLHLHCVSFLVFKLWHARVLTVKFSVTLKTSIIDFIVIVFLFFQHFVFVFPDSLKPFRLAVFLFYFRTHGFCRSNRKSIGNKRPFGPTNDCSFK